MTTIAETPSELALRLRRHRARKAKGKACATVEVSAQVLDLLVRENFLPQQQKFTVAQITDALTKYLERQSAVK